MRHPNTRKLLGPASDHLAIEKQRLLRGASGDEEAQGICVDVYKVTSKRDPEDILAKVKDIMVRVNAECTHGKWPEDSKWLSLLPDWFIDECRPEYTEEEWQLERERDLTMSDEQRMAAAREAKWTLGSWLMYMAPDERYWLWWDANINEQGALIVGLDRLEDFYPEIPGEFEWILTAAGAVEVETLLSPDKEILFRREQTKK